MNNIIKIICFLFVLLNINLIYGQNREPYERILSYGNERDDGGYKFWFTSDDGIERAETGIYRDSPEGPIVQVEGQYAYPIGNTKFSVIYEADENGYRPRVNFGDISGGSSDRFGGYSRGRFTGPDPIPS